MHKKGEEKWLSNDTNILKIEKNGFTKDLTQK